MKKIFLQNHKLEEDRIILDVATSHHLQHVLRYRVGDPVLVSDEKEWEYVTRLGETLGNQLTLLIDEKRPLQTPSSQIVLVQGICKGEKMDWIIQKATELGVSAIIPLETERTIVRLEENKESKRRERWQKIALEAAKQSGADKVPEILPVLKIKLLPDMLRSTPGKHLFLWEEEEQKGLRSGLRELTVESLERVTVIIGPEGGFTPQEAEKIIASGGMPLHMGRRILRAETAALAALAIVMYETGEME